MNSYAQYKNQSLSTLAPGEILVRLFDEAIKQCAIAKKGIETQNYEAVNDGIIKSQDILYALESALDMRFTISKNLRDIYFFIASRLMQANVKKDTSIIDEVVPLIKDLRSSFEQADKACRSQQAAVGGKAV